MANPFVHVELSTDNPGKAKEFYKKIFDWKLDDMPMPNGTYTLINVGEGVGGGMMQKRAPQAPNAWLAYVLVDSIDGTVKKAREFGAKILVEKTAIPNEGSFAVFTDPTGAPLGVWESAKKK